MQTQSLGSRRTQSADTSAGFVRPELLTNETDLVPCPFHLEWTSGNGPHGKDAVAHAATFVPTTRTWSNSTFVTGATSTGIAPAEADAMVDEMFRRYEARVALAPEEHAMDYVHSYLHVAKAD